MKPARLERYHVRLDLRLGPVDRTVELGDGGRLGELLLTRPVAGPPQPNVAQPELRHPAAVQDQGGDGVGGGPVRAKVDPIVAKALGHIEHLREGQLNEGPDGVRFEFHVRQGSGRSPGGSSAVVGDAGVEIGDRGGQAGGTTRWASPFRDKRCWLRSDRRATAPTIQRMRPVDRLGQRRPVLVGETVGMTPPPDRPLAAISLEGLRTRRREIVDLAARRGAHAVQVFGSVARGEQRPGSDIDLLVEFEPGRSLFDLGGLICDLEDLLGGPVDVVTADELRPYVRERVLTDAVPL